MHRWLSFFCALAFIMVSSIGTTAHAAETFNCTPVSAEAAGHYEGDRDEVPADQGSDVAHHHAGCAGHHFAAPTATAEIQLSRRVSDPSSLADDQRAHSRSPDNQLRPPIA